VLVTASGLVAIAALASSIVAAPIGGKLCDKFGTRIVIVCALLTAAILFALLCIEELPLAAFTVILFFAG